MEDIHEHVENLRWAIEVPRQQGADRFVVLGDVFETGKRLDRAVAARQSSLPRLAHDAPCRQATAGWKSG